MSANNKVKAIFEFENGNITLFNEPTKHVHKRFPSGLFSCYSDNQNVLHIKREEFHEVHTPFPHQNSKVIIDSIAKFLNPDMRKKCNAMDYVYKFNVLLFGEQGTGKTALTNYIAKQVIDVHEGIVIICGGVYNISAVLSLANSIREIQEDTPIMILMDEFEVYCKGDKEAMIKNILDGINSIDYSMVFGATNYLDRVPPTIKNRPSRFHIVAEIPPIQDADIVKDLISATVNKAEEPFLDAGGIKSLVDKIMNGEKAVTVDNIKGHILQELMNLQLEIKGEGRIGFGNKKSETKIEPITTIEEQLDALRTQYKSKDE